MRGDRLRSRGLALVACVLLAAAGLARAAGPEGGSSGEFARGVHEGRAYRLFVPSAGAGPLPLIVALHGCWQTPEDFALGTRLNEAAITRGLLVLYPAQGPRRNRSRCWNWFEPPGPTPRGGEVGEILALVGVVRAERQVDARRVFAVGFSAGGFMAVNLACAAPELVAGVGVVGGGPYRCGLGRAGALACMRGFVDGAASAKACLAAMGRRPHDVRASLWHGTEDTLVSPRNLDALVMMFAPLGGMASGVTQARQGALHSVYRDGRGRPVLEAWLVRGLGHAWSGGDTRGTHTVAWGPNTTELMLDYLLGEGGPPPPSRLPR